MCFIDLLLGATAQKKPAIHQALMMLVTSKNILFLGHNPLLTTGTNDPTL